MTLHRRLVDRSRLFSTLVASLLVTGCASSGQGGASAPSRQRDVITSEEVAGLAVGDLYQVIEQLRPLWLRSGGARSLTADTQIAVVVDGVYYGGPETLRQITTPSVVQVRYLDGPEAAATITGVVGSGRNVEGAIVVTLGGGSR